MSVRNRHRRSSRALATMLLTLPIASAIAGATPAGAVTATTERMSVDSGTVGPRQSPAMSADGDRVVFSASGTTNHGIWLRDRSDDTTYRITNGNHFRPDISGDGNTIVYTDGGVSSAVWVVDVTDPTAPGDPVRVDLRDGSTTTHSNGASDNPALDFTGNLVAFQSSATNLTPDTPVTSSTSSKVYVRDIALDETTMVSVDNDGDVLAGMAVLPDITPDGQYVAFASDQDLVENTSVRQVYVHDRDTGDVVVVSVNDDGDLGDAASALVHAPSISDDGLRVAFESDATNLVPFDSNGRTDAFVRDLDTDETRRVGEEAAVEEFGPFMPTTPTRLLDTRVSGTAMGDNQLLTLSIAGEDGVPNSATAVALTVTTVSATARSYVTVYPAGATRPNTSSVNVAPGAPRANAVTVGLGTGGDISMYNFNGPVHVIVDIVGYYADESVTADGGGFVPMTGVRLADTRLVGGALAAGEHRAFAAAGVKGIPETATALVLNVTATEATLQSHLRVYAAGDALPPSSSLNFGAGQTVANSVIVELGVNGKFEVYNRQGTVDVVVDVFGYFDPNADHGGFVALTPQRLLDTRLTSSPLSGTVGRYLLVSGRGGVPHSGVTAVALNVAVVNPTTKGYLRVIPEGSTPTTSNINYAAGEVRSNQVIVALGDLGKIRLLNPYGSAHVVVDVVGYFTGVQLGSGAMAPVISGDGLAVAFESASGSLVDNDDNMNLDVFLVELDGDAVERISVPVSGGSEAGALAPNGYDAAMGTTGDLVAFVSHGDLADDREGVSSEPAVYLRIR